MLFRHRLLQTVTLTPPWCPSAGRYPRSREVTSPTGERRARAPGASALSAVANNKIVVVRESRFLFGGGRGSFDKRVMWPKGCSIMSQGKGGHDVAGLL